MLQVVGLAEEGARVELESFGDVRHEYVPIPRKPLCGTSSGSSDNLLTQALVIISRKACCFT